MRITIIESQETGRGCMPIALHVSVRSKGRETVWDDFNSSAAAKGEAVRGKIASSISQLIKHGCQKLLRRWPTIGSRRIAGIMPDLVRTRPQHSNQEYVQ